MAKQSNQVPKLKILDFKAKTIYGNLRLIDESKRGLNIRDDKGNISIDNLGGYLDPSMETEKLRDVFKAHKSEFSDKFVMKAGRYDITKTIINVEFVGAYKMYNEEKCHSGIRYVLDGYSRDDYADCLDEDDNLIGHICVKEIDNEKKIIAIELPVFKYVDDEIVPDYARYKKVQEPYPLGDDFPTDISCLDWYFRYNEELMIYERQVTASGITREFRVIRKVSDLRKDLYINGFDVDGMHYVRYKRSAGRSREGSCLFIAEPLYEDMMEWSATGLDPNNIKDLASWEAYIALTLSNNKRTIKLPRASILIMRDKESVFKDKAMVVEKRTSNEALMNIIDKYSQKNNAEELIEKNRHKADYLYASEKDYEFHNKIWDGQSLLDASVFEELKEDSDDTAHGMAVLRNNFFKTCAFNTNIQKWFEYKKITKVSQLNGYTTARKLEDIKLITTESSVKYLKMTGLDLKDDKNFNAACDQWLRNIQPIFGIVKFDKPTKYFGGDMVATTYQLVNTLELSYDDVKQLFKPTAEYIEKIKKSPMFLRQYLNINLSYDDEDYYIDDIDDIENIEDFSTMFGEDDEENDADNYDPDDILNYKHKATLDMMDKTDKFSGTKFYQKVQSDAVKNIKKKLKKGKVLVDGLYATLFGNGLEMLECATDKNYEVGESELEGNQIYCKRFADGEELLCSRNPHITMGNILVTHNKVRNNKIKLKDDDEGKDPYDVFFNLTDEIVCVNAINNDIQDRLNGCDYDSDTMLITNNEIMLNAARKNYDKYLVPTCDINTKNIYYPNTPEGKADLDNNIADNTIGTIVNSSQRFNSILWDNVYKGIKDDTLYPVICQLAVLSGIAIDKAKRKYDIEIKDALEKIGWYKEAHYGDCKNPKFFEFINKRKVDNGQDYHTAMQYFYDVGNTSLMGKIIELDIGKIDDKKNRAINVSELIAGAEITMGNNDYKYKKEIIEAAKETVRTVGYIGFMSKRATPSEKARYRDDKRDAILKFKNVVEKRLTSTHIIKMLLDVVDSKDYSDISRTLFGMLCCEGKHRFYDMIVNCRTHQMSELTQVDEKTDDTYDIMGKPFNKVDIK